MSDDAVWRALGLDELDVGLYRRLLDEPGAGTDAHAAALGRAAPEVEASLARLDELGLVLVRAGHVVVHPPSAALAALAGRRRRVLDEAERLTPLLDRLYDAGRAETASDGLVEVVSGGPQIIARLRAMLGQTHESLLLVDSPPYVSSPDPVLHDEETAAAARGVVIRTLVDFSAVDVPDHLRDLVRSVEEGQQVRLAHQVSTKLVISDRRRALLPIAVDPELSRPQAAVVTHPELVGPLVQLFDLMFEQAFPLTEVLGEAGGADAVASQPAALADPTLLRLLATGANDVAIARRLDVSERTLRRRIAGLQDRYRARSRFQLGVMVERERAARRAAD
ncbi:LuxR family transcriptional regulator [Nocardioides marinquilinus]|uniref:LuxR family transcriptional regulator n=1 Tax=Nocardioides marinquilinus TaxID=1210400 RepID=A0ABP9PAU6_9ACTN